MIKEIHEFGEDGQQVYKVYAKKANGGGYEYIINLYSDDRELIESFCLIDGEAKIVDV